MTDLIGQSLGRYHILEQLGEGGMATVYKALDTRLDNEVAVKLIKVENLPMASVERAVKRFEREAKSLARLTHPNIVKVMDYGEFDHRPYLVMEYLPGGTLKQKLGKPIPYQEAARMLAPIARALEYAHEHNLIHRDVKPGNILLTEKGQPMLSDFGIAKIIEEDGTLDLTGTRGTIGTPEYMSPEQCLGNPVDARSDVYSLGVVLYEMLTGRKPFSADTPMKVVLMHASEPLPHPGQFVPNLPKAVEGVLLKALAKRPDDRYRDMQSFAEALEGLGSGQARLVPPAKTRPEKSVVGAPPVQKPVVLKKVEPKQSSSQPPALTRKPFDRRWILALGGIILLFVIVLGLVFLGLPGNGFLKKTATPTLTKLPSATLSRTPVPTLTFTPRSSLTSTTSVTLLPDNTITLVVSTPTVQVTYCDYGVKVVPPFAINIHCECLDQMCSCSQTVIDTKTGNTLESWRSPWRASLETVRAEAKQNKVNCP